MSQPKLSHKPKTAIRQCLEVVFNASEEATFHFDNWVARGRLSGAYERHLSQEQWKQMNKDVKTKRALKVLVRRNWIQARNIGDEMIIRLDQSALIDHLKSNIKHSMVELGSGQYCMVIFDVPQAASRARDHLRRFLKKAGFDQLQLSVLISSKDVLDDLVSLVQLSGVEKWVRVFLVREWT